MNPLKVIRQKCLECSNNSPNEVKLCPVTKCALYPYRFGTNPFRKKREMTEEQKEELKERLKKGREKNECG